MGVLRILDEHEETTYLWDSDSSVRCRIARENFEYCLKQGFIAYKTLQPGKIGIPLIKFDSKADEIVMIRLADGG
jgi:hypothetical protein